MDDQKRIAGKINKIRGVSNQLCQTYETKLHDIDDLRQSLLQKAFAGELT